MELRSDNLVTGINLSIAGGKTTFDDNFIDLDARGRATIPISSSVTAGELTRRLKIRWL